MAVLPVVSDLAFALAKRVAFEAIGTTKDVAVALVGDQIRGGLWLVKSTLFAAFGAGQMVAPHLISAVGWVCKTLAMEVWERIKMLYSKAVRSYRIRQACQMIKDGAIIELHAWLRSDDQAMSQRPIEPIHLVECAIEAKELSRERRLGLLTMILGRTERILNGHLAYRQLYSSLLIRDDLPASYLEMAVGSDPIGSLSKEWWLEEFMSRLVLFKDLAFREYMLFFFKVFPTFHENIVLYDLVIPKDVPSGYKRDCLQNLQLYYTLSRPLESEYRYPVEGNGSLRALEIYLELSRFIAKVHKRTEKYQEVLGWIKESFFEEEEGAGKSILESIIKQDLQNTLKIYLYTREIQDQPSMSEMLQQSQKECSTGCYSVLLAMNNGTVEEPPTNACLAIHRLFKLAREVRQHELRFHTLCFEVAVSVQRIKIDFDRILGGRVPELGRIILAGFLLEAVYDLDRNHINLSALHHQHSNQMDIAQLVQASLDQYCTDRAMWPASKMYNVQLDNADEMSILLPKEIFTSSIFSGQIKASRVGEEQKYLQTMAKNLKYYQDAGNRQAFGELAEELLKHYRSKGDTIALKELAKETLENYIYAGNRYALERLSKELLGNREITLQTWKGLLELAIKLDLKDSFTFLYCHAQRTLSSNFSRMQELALLIPPNDEAWKRASRCT